MQINPKNEKIFFNAGFTFKTCTSSLYEHHDKYLGPHFIYYFFTNTCDVRDYPLVGCQIQSSIIMKMLKNLDSVTTTT